MLIVIHEVNYYSKLYSEIYFIHFETLEWQNYADIYSRIFQSRLYIILYSMSIGVHEIKPRWSRLINQCNSDFNNNHAALSEHSVAVALIRYHDNNVITRPALTNPILWSILQTKKRRGFSTLFCASFYHFAMPFHHIWQMGFELTYRVTCVLLFSFSILYQATIYFPSPPQYFSATAAYHGRRREDSLVSAYPPFL